MLFPIKTNETLEAKINIPRCSFKQKEILTILTYSLEIHIYTINIGPTDKSFTPYPLILFLL